MENNYEIKYSDTRHGYARLDKEGKLTISVPIFLRNNKKFQEELITKGQKLISRYNKKTHIDVISDYKILLFGEQTDKTNLGKNKRQLQLELKNILYEYSKPILDSLSIKIGKTYSDLKIKKLKAKWGSCSANQIIVLNQDLIHLPNKLIKYVIIHEACHLKYKHHQKSFRNMVEKYCPNYKILRKELRNLIIR